MTESHSGRVRHFFSSWFWPILVAWLSLFVLGLIDNSRGPIFPDVLRQFTLNDTRGSFFFLMTSLASVAHNFVFHKFLSETSPKRLIGMYTLVMAGGAMIMAEASSFSWMLGGCFVLGVGFGGLGVGQNAAVQSAPRKYRQQSIGLLHGMYGISSFAAPLAVAVFADWGWRSAFVFVSLPAVVVGLFVVGESFFSRKSSYESRLIHKVDDDDPPALASDKVRSATFLAAIVIGLLVVAEISVSSRLALLARREWGVSQEGANGWLAAYFAAMTMSRMMLGLVRFPMPVKVIVRAAMIGGLPFLLAAFLPLGLPANVRLFFLVAFGFPIAMGYPLVMTRIAEIFGRGAQRVTSVCVLFQAGMAVLMHFALGWGADLIGLPSALGIISVVSLAGVVFSLWIFEKRVAG